MMLLHYLTKVPRQLGFTPRAPLIDIDVAQQSLDCRTIVDETGHGFDSTLTHAAWRCVVQPGRRTTL